MNFFYSPHSLFNVADAPAVFSEGFAILCSRKVNFLSHVMDEVGFSDSYLEFEQISSSDLDHLYRGVFFICAPLHLCKELTLPGKKDT